LPRCGSLGYLAGGDSRPASEVSGIDPKDRPLDFEAQNRAVLLASSGRLQQSNALLEQLIQKLPDIFRTAVKPGIEPAAPGPARQGRPRVSRSG